MADNGSFFVFNNMDSESVYFLCETCEAAFFRREAAEKHVERCARLREDSVSAVSPPAAAPQVATTPFPAAATPVSNDRQPDLPLASTSHQYSQPGGSKDDDKFVWHMDATKSLLSLYKENEDVMNDNKTRKSTVWVKICDELNTQGYNLRVSQVEGKWKTLMKSYKKVVDHNNKSGNDRKSCPFFEELDEMFGMRPNVMPAATSSLGVTQTASSEADTPKKRDGKRKSTSVLEWLKDWSEKRSLEEENYQKLAEARFEAQQRNFERKMDFMERLLTQLKKDD